MTANVNAFALLDDGSLLLAFKANQSIGGLGTVTPQDVVQFVPDSLGPTTAGQFAWLLDGSTVGLTTSGERIDALAIDPASGRLLLSTMGTARVSGPDGTIRSHDEDILAYDLANGDWSLFFDGTLVPGLKGEDINGLAVDSATGDLYVVILGGFNLGGVGGNGRDIVRFVPDEGSYVPVEVVWDGSALGFPVNVDAISMTP